MQTKKNCKHNLPVNKKMHLEFRGKRTIIKIRSIKGAGGWYLVFSHGIEITAWTGNVSGIFYSNLPSWKWGMVSLSAATASLTLIFCLSLSTFFGALVP